MESACIEAKAPTRTRVGSREASIKAQSVIIMNEASSSSRESHHQHTRGETDSVVWNESVKQQSLATTVFMSRRLSVSVPSTMASDGCVVGFTVCLSFPCSRGSNRQLVVRYISTRTAAFR